MDFDPRTALWRTNALHAPSQRLPAALRRSSSSERERAVKRIDRVSAYPFAPKRALTRLKSSLFFECTRDW